MNDASRRIGSGVMTLALLLAACGAPDGPASHAPGKSEDTGATAGGCLASLELRVLALGASRLCVGGVPVAKVQLVQAGKHAPDRLIFEMLRSGNQMTLDLWSLRVQAYSLSKSERASLERALAPIAARDLAERLSSSDHQTLAAEHCRSGVLTLFYLAAVAAPAGIFVGEGAAIPLSSAAEGAASRLVHLLLSNGAFGVELATPTAALMATLGPAMAGLVHTLYSDGDWCEVWSLFVAIRDAVVGR